MWLDIAGAEVDELTAETWKRYAKAHWVPYFDTFQQITTASIADYARLRLKEVRAVTVRKELSALRGFLRWCEEQGHLDEAPKVKSIPKRATGTSAVEQVRVDLTAEQAAAIIAALPEQTRMGNRPRAFFAFMWETALRRATLWELRAPGDYHPGRATLRIRKEADKSRYDRELPLSPLAREILDDVCPKEGRIFPAVDFRYVLREAARAAGLSEHDAAHLSNHDFRHGALTHLAETSGDLLAISYLGGHKHLTTTSRYLHARQAAAARALEARAAGSPAGTPKRPRPRRPK
jgi:integrase